MGKGVKTDLKKDKKANFDKKEVSKNKESVKSKSDKTISKNLETKIKEAKIISEAIEKAGKQDGGGKSEDKLEKKAKEIHDKEKLEKKTEDRKPAHGFYNALHRLLKHYERMLMSDFYRNNSNSYQSYSPRTEESVSEELSMADVDDIIMNQKLKSVGLSEACHINYKTMEAYKIWASMSQNRVLSFVKYSLSLT